MNKFNFNFNNIYMYISNLISSIIMSIILICSYFVDMIVRSDFYIMKYIMKYTNKDLGNSTQTYSQRTSDRCFLDSYKKTIRDTLWIWATLFMYICNNECVIIGLMIFFMLMPRTVGGIVNYIIVKMRKLINSLSYKYEYCVRDSNYNYIPCLLLFYFIYFVYLLVILVFILYFIL